MFLDARRRFAPAPIYRWRCKLRTVMTRTPRTASPGPAYDKQYPARVGGIAGRQDRGSTGPAMLIIHMKRLTLSAVSLACATACATLALAPALGQQPAPQSASQIAPQPPGGRAGGRAPANIPPPIPAKPEELAKVNEETAPPASLLNGLKRQHARSADAWRRRG